MTLIIPRESQSIADNFRSKWHLMRNVERDRDRESLLRRDQIEVKHEMIYQEFQEGEKTHQELADEFHVNKSTVWRVLNARGRI